MATDFMETINVEDLSDEQIDRLQRRLDQRREKREAEQKARAAAIKRSHSPQAAFDAMTKFKMNRGAMESIEDPERGVRLYEDGAHVLLAGQLGQLAGMYDRIEEPTDPLRRAAVRMDFYQTRARLVHGAQRQIVLNDSRRCMEAGLCNAPPAANTLELARLDALIASDTAKAKRLEGLCDLLNQIKTQHPNDEALRDRLVAQALETEAMPTA